MIAVRNLLLSGQYGPDDTVARPTSILFPEHRALWAEDTTYRIVVETVTGSPSAAALTAKFQVAQTTTGGASGTAHTNTADRLPVWGDVDATTNPGLFPDGDWPATVADQTASGLLVLRRIRGGSSHRLVLAMSYTGGTTPGFVLTVESTMRGQ